MKLRSGKKYKFENCWWYKYTIEASHVEKGEDDRHFFKYNEYSVKYWLDVILPLYERV
jgi:hypothetical protein